MLEKILRVNELVYFLNSKGEKLILDHTNLLIEVRDSKKGCESLIEPIYLHDDNFWEKEPMKRIKKLIKILEKRCKKYE